MNIGTDTEIPTSGFVGICSNLHITFYFIKNDIKITSHSTDEVLLKNTYTNLRPQRVYTTNTLYTELEDEHQHL